MSRKLFTALAATALWLAAGCQAPPPPRMPALAHSQISNDFETYEVRRVGLMPFAGKALDDGFAAAMRAGLATELGESTRLEIVLLDERDVEETAVSEPYRRGWYRPKTIIALSRRYRLDAILFGTVTQQRFFPPQSLGVQVDMVAGETGLVIWSSSVQLDANDPRVRDGLRVFYASREAPIEEERDWELALLSPERFARFAAYQIAASL